MATAVSFRPYLFSCKLKKRFAIKLPGEHPKMENWQHFVSAMLICMNYDHWLQKFQ